MLTGEKVIYLTLREVIVTGCLQVKYSSSFLKQKYHAIILKFIKSWMMRW